MKPAIFIVVLAVCGTALLAQGTAPSRDVTMGMTPNAPEYCEGAFRPMGLTDSDDIALRLPLKVWYENHLSEKVLLSRDFDWVINATVAGQNSPVASRRGGGGTKDVNKPSFSTITLEKAEPTVVNLVQCLSEKDPGCTNAYMYIPVLDRTKALDLRGKTVEIKLTRDHSLAPDMVTKLKEKVNNSGTVFSGTVESEVVTIWIPNEPLTKNCPFTG